MISFDNYLNGLLNQIFDSYKILDGLNDKTGDLPIIKNELLKINGVVKVLINKLDSIDNSSNEVMSLSIAAKHYLENYDFLREIEAISKLYSEDSNRLKNIRYTILNALRDKKFIEKIEFIITKSNLH